MEGLLLKLTLPLKMVFDIIRKPFMLGFPPRLDKFERLKGARGVDLDIVPEGYLGYVTYPDYSLYVAPKGIKQQARKKSPRISGRKASHAHKSAQKFFDSGICDFQATVSRSTDSKMDDFGGSAYQLVEQVISPLMKSSEPSTVLIGGKIGGGKSTLIGAIMHAIGSNPYIGESWSMVLVKLDLRHVLRHLIDSAIQNEFPNEYAFIDEIEGALCRALKIKLKNAGIKVEESDPVFEDLLTSCDNQQAVPIFVFDELDTIYYSFCLASAKPGSSTIQQHRIFDHYSKLVGYFFNLAKSRLRKSTFSPLVILAARSSTIRLMNEVQANRTNLGSPTFHFPEAEINLARPNNERICEIVATWTKFYIHKLEMARHGDSEFAKNLRVACKLLTSDNLPDFSKNLECSVHGLRHVTKVLGKALAKDDTGALFLSYIKHPSLLRIYQYLDGCQFYSQTTEGVSNIFLVNSDFRSPDELSNEYIPTQLYRPHLQSYWLKYFLMKYVCFKQGQNGIGPLITQDIVDLFCFRGADGQGPLRYEKEILHLIILHATEVVHGRLLKLGTYSNGASTKLIASERAMLFDSKSLFWEFGYLFVCIEDDWLELPRGVATYFSVDEDWKSAFHFTTRYYSLSTAQKLKFIEYKAKRVLVFVRLLELALVSEARRYRDVFSRLEEELKEDFHSASFMVQRRDIVLDSIAAFARAYVGDRAEEDIRIFCSKFLKSDKYKQIEKAMKRRMMEYDRSLIPVRAIESHMKHYHRSTALET